MDRKNIKRSGSVAILSAIVAFAGAATITPASAHSLAAPKKPYGCDKKNPPKKCQTGTGGVRVVGGANGTTGTTSGTRSSGGANGTGKTGANGKSGANGKNGAGANGKNGAGANGKNAGGANAAGANGSSPAPAQGLPVTGYGGAAQDLGASPRMAVAGTRPVVVGLASFPSTARVAALPATGGGGIPSQPSSPVLALLAGALAVLGLGLRKVASRF